MWVEEAHFIVMSLECILVIGYLAIGIIMAFIWWNDEYKAEYEYEKENGDTEDSMAIILLLLFTCFWPFKLVKNYLESLFF
jgi:hypothetical protein